MDNYEPQIGDKVTDSYDNGEGIVTALKIDKYGGGEKRWWVWFLKQDRPLHCDTNSLMLVGVATNEEIVAVRNKWRANINYGK